MGKLDQTLNIRALLASSGLCQRPEAHVGGGREGHVGCEAGGGGQAQGVVQRDGRRAGRGEADLMMMARLRLAVSVGAVG